MPKNEVFQPKWGLKLIFMQFWVASARFKCKNTTFLLNKLFSRMKLKIWLFWGLRRPQKPSEPKTHIKCTIFNIVSWERSHFATFYLYFYMVKKKLPFSHWNIKIPRGGLKFRKSLIDQFLYFLQFQKYVSQ